MRVLFMLLWGLLLVSIIAAQGAGETLIAYTPVKQLPVTARSMVSAPGDLMWVTPYGKPVEYVETDMYDPAGWDWSADGRYVLHGTHTGIAVLDRHYPAQYFVTQPQQEMQYLWSAWSPDAEQIAYAASQPTRRDLSQPQHFRYHLFITGSEGGQHRLLTEEVELWSKPVWSPGGREILFLGMKPGWDKNRVRPPQGLYKINTDGTSLKQLAENAASPVWSPDGGRVAFTTLHGGEDTPDSRTSRIEIVDSSGQNRRVLAEGAGWRFIRAPWSANGRYLLYQNDEPLKGLSQLWLLDVETGVESPLAKARTIGGADWSPDGTQIVYSPSAGGAADICIIAITTREERCLGVEAHWLSEPRWRSVQYMNSG